MKNGVRVCHKQGNRFILSVIDPLTRLIFSLPIKDNAARTIVRHLFD